MNLWSGTEGEKEPAMSDFKDCHDQEPCSGPEPLGELLEHLEFSGTPSYICCSFGAESCI